MIDILLDADGRCHDGPTGLKSRSERPGVRVPGTAVRCCRRAVRIFR